MRAAYPAFGPQRVGRGVEWLGPLTPSPASDTYIIKVHYEIPERPEVTVISPELRLAPGKSKLPHVFPPDYKRLCLYIAREWTSEKRIA
jgi:hypothetical protein